MAYVVKRVFFKSGRKVTIHYNLTKEEAKQHCQDRESSSSSCTSKTGKARTRKYGPWFDSYMLDN
jgi:hypothetical protein